MPDPVRVDDLAVRPPAADVSTDDATHRDTVVRHEPPVRRDDTAPRRDAPSSAREETAGHESQVARRTMADHGPPVPADRPRFDVEPAAPLTHVPAAAVRPAGVDRSGDEAVLLGQARTENVVRRSPADAGTVFLGELARHRRQAPAPLPSRLRPLADVIARHRTVRFSTDTASRRALGAVGKQAATTGDVIHLSRMPTTRADDAVVAHELTHVAHPSPLPRFFDDHRPSAEETRAEQVAEIIRRSPVLPRSSAASDIRRTPAPPVSGFTSQRAADTAPSSGGGITADALARQLGFDVGTTPASSGTTIRRSWRDDAGPMTSLSPGGTSTATSPTRSTSQALGGERDSGFAFPFDLSTVLGTRDFVQWLAENLGDRIMRDLELRGGRQRGGS
jgi:hypothetical protein